MPPVDPPSPDPSLPPSPSTDPASAPASIRPLSPEKSPPVPLAGTPQSSATGYRASLDSLADDELVADKKRLVAAFDQIVEPLNQILGLMRHAWRGGVILLAFMAVMTGVQVHTTLRMVDVQEQLAEVVAAQKTLQQTTTQVADKQTATQAALNQQSQITIEPSLGPDGSTTAIVVVRPPLASSTLPAIPLPLAPTMAPLPPVKGGSMAGTSPGRQPRLASSAAGSASVAPPLAVPTGAAMPPPAPSPIKFE